MKRKSLKETRPGSPNKLVAGVRVEPVSPDTIQACSLTPRLIESKDVRLFGRFHTAYLHSLQYPSAH